MTTINECRRINWNLLRILFASILIAGLASGCFESQWEEQVLSNPSVAKVSTTVLGKVFEADASSAKQQYKGKIIEVYGPVQEVHDEGDRTLVILRGDNGEEIFCPVSSKHSVDLDNLELGRIALIKGKCRGIVRGDITLGGCIIIDPLRELKTKARNGDVSSQISLAKALSKPNKSTEDLRWAFHLYCKVAESGHEEAQGTVMGALMGAWGPETNAPVIWGWLQEEATGGNTEACYQLGLLYNMSEDFGIDPQASVPWFKKASDGGHQEAMFTMASFYYGGTLVKTNKVESARLLSLVDPKNLPQAPETLGLMVLTGDGVPKNIEKGISLLESAVEHGRAQTATTLGHIYLAGEFVPEDKAKALKWFQKAGEMGDVQGMVKAGLLDTDSRSRSRRKRGKKLILNAMNLDQKTAYPEILSHVTESVAKEMEARNPPVATNTPISIRRINGSMVKGKYLGIENAKLLIDLGTKTDSIPFTHIDVNGRTRYDQEFRELLARSIVLERTYALLDGFTPPQSKPSKEDPMKNLREWADDGDPVAQAWLGGILIEDKKTAEEGLNWLKKSAESGSSEGQYSLGIAYLKGLALPVDKKEAFRLFGLASEQGHTEALLEAGKMLIKGDGCKRNRKEGLNLVRLSAEEMEPEAILYLGQYLYGGRRGLRDAAQAFAWFRLGSMLDMPESQFWLGRMYYEGKGVPKDYNRSIQWLSEAASQGYKPAADLLASDDAQKKEMAKAKIAYQEELERHSKELERIRTNPKYDRVSFSRTPSFFKANEKEAYQRFTRNYMRGRFNSNIARCADEAYRYVNSGGARRNRSTKAGQSSGGGIRNLGRGEDGLYDGVGSSGKLYTSPDGHTWTVNLGYRPGGARPPSYSGGFDSSFPSSSFGSGDGQWSGVSGGMGSMMDGSMRAFKNRWNSSGGQ